MENVAMFWSLYASRYIEATMLMNELECRYNEAA